MTTPRTTDPADLLTADQFEAALAAHQAATGHCLMVQSVCEHGLRKYAICAPCELVFETEHSVTHGGGLDLDALAEQWPVWQALHLEHITGMGS